MEVRGWALLLFFLVTLVLDLSLVFVIDGLERALMAETQRADRIVRELERVSKQRDACTAAAALPNIVTARGQHHRDMNVTL